MIGQVLLALAFAATGIAQAPEGYRTVYITSNVDTKFVVVPKAATSGSGVVVQTGAQKPEQQWYLTDGSSKIQLANTELCLDAGAKSAWKDMANVYVNTCSDTAEGQKWNVMADGRIAVEGSTPQECLDLQFMRATENNPVGLYSCAGLGNTGAADKGINWPLTEVAP
ncbi:carbohydrate-binding module family 13 protein [Hypoxylon fragiforme]|uniref:carbohydrate-binding module family 13 protein n=1 Tax=Hypoxylon fragiforme TaxID=63214 RepID=UPI0020C62255|nr:carbohydrate-binding module family 13 protein [Hypoxylon fragiforme]KAI2608221.1 carbohydrate-binding module family 13 protein [Hypoxylon fragiforme]